ncbi:MAG: 9-O-acetylesterase [Opitutaceae bacterium]|nr:9-O-acetylesterase [Opitutaceae bacterium]
MLPSLTLHPLFSDHAVLPRDREIPIFGRSVPGQAVKVALGPRVASVRADALGQWEVRLEPLPAGGPHTLTVSTPSKQLFRRNILIGDIWIAAGQSNMEWPLSDSAGADDAIEAARYPRVRLFTVPHRGSLVPEAECGGQWSECSPKVAAGFSAVAFHFARVVQGSIECPVGIIQATWGGTGIASWIPGDVLKGRVEFSPVSAPIGRVRELIEPPPPIVHVDTGNAGEGKGWALESLTDAKLPELVVPGAWQAQGLSFNGAVWLRRWVDVPLSWASHRLRLELGAVDDFDRTYFNGAAIGGIGAENPDAWRTPRRYVVPEGLVRPGANLIAVRVFDRGGNGGIIGPAGAMRLYPDGRPHEAIPLAGRWKYVVERQIPIAAPSLADGRMPEPDYPSGLFNGMIAPLTRLPARGVIWYQGESDVGRAGLYRSLFAELIRSWRGQWRIAELPFLFVQLANHLPRRDEPADDPWAELREAQAQALREPATGMAVAADVGDADDIHPRDKKTVGERLALGALAVAYRRSMPYSGPLYAGHAVEGAGIRVRFAHVDGGLRTRGGAIVQGFAIAGADRKFRWADARIEQASIVVSHPAIAQPVAVRYAWEANPMLSLENGLGLPASPFRTDTWDVTVSAR